MGGRNSSSESGIEGFVLDFNDGKLDIHPVNSVLEFDMNNVSIANKNGNLLFYSNGCAIANANHEIMENGEGINAGAFLEYIWEPDCSLGYPGYQDIISIPDPYDELGYYLITKPRLLDQDYNAYLDVIQYSYINFSNELGSVTIKNDTIISGTELLSGYFSGVKVNQDFWWILQPTTNPISFVKLILNKDGIFHHSTQFIGSDLHFDASAGGTAVFSPSGEKYAFYNKYDQLHLFDFELENGQLSNHEVIYVTDAPLFTSVEFSSNGRFIYVSTQESIHQVDIRSTSGEYEVELIAEFNGIQNPQRADMFLLRRGPDCRIYIAATSESKSYGVINYPNKKGKDCELIQQGIDLPYMTGRVSLPNFPNYRSNGEEVCDSTITGLASAVEDFKQKFLLYPNPTTNYTDILLPKNNIEGEIEIHNNLGQKVLSQTISGYEERIDLTPLKTGHYFISVLTKGIRFKSEPLVIIDD